MKIIMWIDNLDLRSRSDHDKIMWWNIIGRSNQEWWEEALPTRAQSTALFRHSRMMYVPQNPYVLRSVSQYTNIYKKWHRNPEGGRKEMNWLWFILNIHVNGKLGRYTDLGVLNCRVPWLFTRDFCLILAGLAPGMSSCFWLWNRFVVF